MVGKAFLPRQDDALIDGANRTTTPFYVFFQALEAQLFAAGVTQAEFDALVARVAELESSNGSTYMLVGVGSVLVQGTPAGGFVQITLQGDREEPGVRYRYGTGADGVKSWSRVYDDFEAGPGILKTDSGYLIAGEVEDVGDLPLTGTTGEAWRVYSGDNPGLYAWDGAAWVIDLAATGLVGFRLENPAGGVLPVVTGEVPPVFVYFDDGSLLYAPASY